MTTLQSPFLRFFWCLETSTAFEAAASHAAGQKNQPWKGRFDAAFVCFKSILTRTIFFEGPTYLFLFFPFDEKSALHHLLQDLHDIPSVPAKEHVGDLLRPTGGSVLPGNGWLLAFGRSSCEEAMVFWNLFLAKKVVP